VHLLLLRSIEHIADKRPNLLSPSFTSREIGALAQVPIAARAIFSPIVETVERALFAGRDIGAGEFTACRQAYEQFALGRFWDAGS